MKKFEYKIVERRFYFAKGETIIEKTDKHGHHHYSERIAGKTKPITPEYHSLRTTTFFNKLAQTKEAPKQLIKKTEKIKEQEEYDEYTYFVGFDYETSTNRQTIKIVDGKFKTTDKKSHDFHAEYNVTSPIKLDVGGVQKLIISKFPDYSNVLKEDGYEIKSDTMNKVKHKPDFDVTQSGKIKRR